VSVPAGSTAFPELVKTCRIVREYAESRGLRVYELSPDRETPYPFLVVTFKENDLTRSDFTEAVALIGHLDVVPAKEREQFSPFLRGLDLYARGAADMKTVVSTFLAWMGWFQQRPGGKPPFVLLLSCCEENGSHQPHHVRSAVEWLHLNYGLAIRFGVVGERTGELEWMGEGLTVGPICTENRSWRWFRLSSRSACGKSGLARIARLVSRCRKTVAELNLSLEDDGHPQRQPGLRSGFLTPFTFVAGARGSGEPRESITVTALCQGGSSFHSAVADVTRTSLAERFNELVAEAETRFGSDNVDLAGVKIGEEGNFNTWDGSGEMQLLLNDVSMEQAGEWVAGRDDSGISLTVREGSVPLVPAPTVAGIDIRELLVHRDGIGDLLTALRKDLGEYESLAVVHDLPSWRCPPDQADLAQLLKAYKAVTREPSPDLVKLHGNDGGNLVAWQHSEERELARRGVGHAVIFGQVGKHPHGSTEFHRGSSIRPYIAILDRWAASYLSE
jgi:hypothetical protein